MASEPNSQKAPKADRFFTNWRIALIGVFVLSVILYLPCIMGASTWDDDLLISGAGLGANRFLTSFTHPFLGIYYRPLTSFSFAVESTFANGTPFFYHQTSILLHALTAVLACCAVFFITKKELAGILAGLFFATQPMQVGAAAWVGGRTDDLSTLFLAAFIVCLVRYHQNGKWIWVMLSVLAFLFAALSKEQAAFILPAVPLSVYAIGSRKSKDALRLCVPFGLAAILYAGLWIYGGPPLLRVHSNFLDTVTLALRTAAHYGLALLVPNRPSLLTFTLENYLGLAWIALGGVFVAGIVAFMWMTWKNHRHLAWLAVCGLLVYLPVSNFPPVPTYVVGPYRIAECGLPAACLLGIGCAYGMTSKRYLLAAALFANLLLGTVTTWWGVHQWNSNDELFATAVQIDPHFIIGITKHAQTLENQGRLNDAIQLRERALRWIFGTDQWVSDLAAHRLSKDSPNVLRVLRTNEGIPYLGEVSWLMCCQASSFTKQRRISDARQLDELALGIEPKDHRINFAYGQLILETDRKRAIHYFEVAHRLAPKSPVYAMALAHERVRDRRYKEAIELLSGIMKAIGWNGSAWIDMADAKIGIHDLEGAASALSSSESAMFKPAKSDVEIRRRRIEALKRLKPEGKG